MTQAQPRTALVLSGGGSRGAYEAGIILYLREGLAQRLGYQVPIDIITGTSVGAINAAFLAATHHEPSTQGRRLAERWRSLRIENLMSLRATDALRAVRLLVGRDLAPPAPGTFRYGGLIDTSGLERFVIQSIGWRNIRRNISAGRLQSLSISATHVGTGHTIVFVHTGQPMPKSWSKNPFVRHAGAQIGPRHVLASAAIPLLFPAVRIGGEFYTDGGLRQNTPMSPAIRLGADRMLLISLRHIASSQETHQLAQERETAFPKPLFLLGKALNALLLDHTDYDLDRMARLNAVLAAGRDAFGDQFTDLLNRELLRLRGAPLREIAALHIRPSEDIGRIASEFAVKGKIDVRGRFARRLIRTLAERESANENDLLSYLLFDGNFASELIQLGYKDAADKEEELAQFFSGGS